MNDFASIVIAFGRGIIKILISALVGFGVGLLVIGIATAGNPDIWRRGSPPGELLMGIGAGLLSGGGTLLALFFLPWFLKRPTSPDRLYPEEAPILAHPAPRASRRTIDDVPLPRPAPPPAPAAADDGMPPTVRPVPPSADPGDAGFYAK